MTHTFKIGDRVRVRTWESMEAEFGISALGFYIRVPNCGFTEGMKQFCGKTYTIQNIIGRMVYLVTDDGKRITSDYSFTLDMLEPAATADYKVVITTDGKTTTAKLYNGKWLESTARAHCHPSDKFCFDTGAMLAMERLFPDAPTVLPKPEPMPEPWFGHVVALGDSVTLPGLSPIWTRGKIYSVEDGLIDTDIPGTVRGKGSHDLPYENFAELDRLFPHQFIEIKGGLPKC